MMYQKELLMVLGPTEIEEDILILGSKHQVYMRTEEFSLRLKKIFSNLQYVFQTKQPVLVAASSGTGMMEAAVLNTLKENDTALVINGGTFGDRWVKICLKHKINVIEKKVPLGESINPLTIKQELDLNPDIKAVLATHNETSTGALTDIKMIGQIVKDYPDTILISDCVSSLIVEPLETDNWNIDIVIGCSQKALAIPPGLGFICFSQKALKFAQKNAERSFYFDVFDHISNWQRGQTPFTPPISLLFQLEKRLEKIKNEGLLQIRENYYKKTKLLRDGLNKLGFEVFAKNSGNCTTAVYTEKYNANEIIMILQNKYNIYITPSGNDLKERLFRIGNFGNIGENEINRFLEALELTLKEMAVAR